MIDAQPPHGAFDYLLDPIRDQLLPPPPQPERRDEAVPQRIPTSRSRPRERRAAIVGAIIGLIMFALLAWGLFG